MIAEPQSKTFTQEEREMLFGEGIEAELSDSGDPPTEPSRRAELIVADIGDGDRQQVWIQDLTNGLGWDVILEVGDAEALGHALLNWAHDEPPLG